MTVGELRRALEKMPQSATVDLEVAGMSAVLVSVDKSGDYAVHLMGAEEAPDPDWDRE